MAAALLVTLAVAVVLLASLAGAPTTTTSVGRVFILGLPLFVIAGATILPVGVVWWTALLMAVATAVAIILAGRIGRSLDDAAQQRPALAAAIATGRSLVAVTLTAVAVRWLVPIIGSFTNLSAVAVTVVVVSAAVAAVVLSGGRFGLARTALALSSIAAVLMLVAGVAVGAPGRVLDPVVPVAGPTLTALLAGLLGVLLIGAVHPGLANLERQSPGTLTKGALVTAAVGLAGLWGLIFLAGGSLDFPSNALVTVSGYIAFAPSVVGGLLAAYIAVVLTVMVAAGLEATLSAWDHHAGVAPIGWLSHRWVAVLAAGLGVYLFSVSAVSGGWLLGTAAIVAAAVLVLRWRASKDGSTQPVEEQEPAAV